MYQPKKNLKCTFSSLKIIKQFFFVDNILLKYKFYNNFPIKNKIYSRMFISFWSFIYVSLTCLKVDTFSIESLHILVIWKVTFKFDLIASFPNSVGMVQFRIIRREQ